jgi:hypothetical protein
VIGKGVFAYSTDTGVLKIGDGVSTWSALYRVATEVTGVRWYTALLTQSGTNAPVATVLENDLGGTVVWTRNNTGVYFGTLAGAFLADKFFAFPVFSINLGAGESSYTQSRGSDDHVIVGTRVNGVAADSFPMQPMCIRFAVFE